MNYDYNYFEEILYEQGDYYKIKENAPVYIKIKVENNNIKFFRAGDFIRFKKVKGSNNYCGANVKDLENFYLVLYVNTRAVFSFYVYQLFTFILFYNFLFLLFYISFFQKFIFFCLNKYIARSLGRCSLRPGRRKSGRRHAGRKSLGTISDSASTKTSSGALGSDRGPTAQP